MSYDKEKIFKECIEIIPKEKIINVKDLVCFLPCCRKTFYNFFPENSPSLLTIKEAINDSKVITKSKLRKNWELSDNAVLQIALYKTIATDDEREKLNTTYQRNDITTKGEKISTNILSFVKTDDND